MFIKFTAIKRKLQFKYTFKVRFIKLKYFDSKYIITFINRCFLLKLLLDLNIKIISKIFNINILGNKKYHMFEFVITLIYILENRNSIKLIKHEIYFIYSESVNIFVKINIIKFKDIFIYYQRDAITISFYSSITVLLIITLKSENFLIIIYLIKEIIVTL